MARAHLILFLFFSLPLLPVSWVLKSRLFFALVAAVGVAGTAVLVARARSGDDLDRGAEPVEPGIESRLARIFSEAGNPRFRPGFLKFRSADPVVKVRVRGGGELRVLFSVAFLETASDADLGKLFAEWDPERVRRIRLENLRDSIRATLDDWKGRPEGFRYWFVSFWLLPLERLLQIARV